MNPALFLRKTGLIASIIPIFIGIVTLIGYGTNNHALKTLGLGVTEMNPVVALLVILSGTMLLGLRFGADSPVKRNVGFGISLLIAYVGAVKIGSLALGHTSLVDTALFLEQLQAGGALTGYPLGMAPNTALTFFFVGIALALLYKQRSLKVVQALLIFAGVPPFVTGIGYLYGAESVSFFTRYIAMAGNTAVALLGVVVSLFSVLPNSAQIKKLATSTTAGGLVFRRLAPLAFVIPVVIGYVIEGLHYYEEVLSIENIVSISVIFTTFALSVIVWHESYSIERISLDKNTDILRSLSLAFAFVSDPVVVTDPKGRVLYANHAVSTHTGFSEEECLGKKPGELWGGHMPKEFYQKMWHTIAV